MDRTRPPNDRATRGCTNASRPPRAGRHRPRVPPGVRTGRSHSGGSVGCLQSNERGDLVVEPVPRGRNPFDDSGVERGRDGVARYLDRPASLVHLLRASVDRDPTAPALVVVGGESLSYEELWERSARVAGGLRRLGIERGDRVAIRLANGIDWVLAFFGAQLIGAAVVPINTRFTDDEAAYVVNDSGAAFTFTHGSGMPDGEPAVFEDLLGDDLAAIFYTSGTTGFPKGAMTSHGNFTTNSENAFRCLFVDRSEGPGICTLVSVPLFHVTG